LQKSGDGRAHGDADQRAIDDGLIGAKPHRSGTASAFGAGSKLRRNAFEKSTAHAVPGWDVVARLEQWQIEGLPANVF
jgi:hypothetical protein